MIYDSAQEWENDPHQKVLLFGMSGLGKTHVSNMLRASGNWFHYSVDFRIGSHYMREHITGDISFDNLEPLASYLGKPGDPDKGGIDFTEYMHRQHQHQQAEVNTLLDTARFIPAARKNHDHFICDSGGSICEVVDPHDKNSHVLKTLSENLLMVWIKGSGDHSAELIKRFDVSPKPMCYHPSFLKRLWAEYLHNNKTTATKVDPDKFVRWAFKMALAERQPRYEAMAKNWGITVSAQDVAKATTPAAFKAMVAHALEKRHSNG